MSKVKIPGENDTLVKRRIVECATRLFASKGYAATSVREIVAGAGVTAPVLYYYFKSKEGIFLEITREGHRQFVEMLTSVQEMKGTAREKITRLVVEMYRIHRLYINEARVIHSAYYGPPESAPQFDFRSFHKNLIVTLEKIVSDGVSCGELARHRIGAINALVLGVLRHCLDAELFFPELAVNEEQLNEIIDVMFRGILPRTCRE